MKTKHAKEKSFSEKFLIFFRIISIIIIIFCLIYIINWYMENKRNSNILNEITNSSIKDTITIEIPTDTTNETNTTNTTEITTYELDFDKLLAKNSSTVGWISVPNTLINYPVVQSSDNSYYLNHSFDKTRNSAGWIFADYRNKFDGTDKNIIIYGHNRVDSSMFATLSNTQKPNWYNDKNNHYIIFSTPEETFVYEVFSTYTIKSETYYLTTNFANDDKYLEFLNTLAKRSVYNFNVNLSAEDSIITLSTCDSTGRSRVILHAKKIM